MEQHLAKSIKTLPTEDEILSWLTKHVADNTDIAATDIDITKPFSYFGMSSVLAISLSGELERWLNRKLSPTLTWDYPTIELLAAHLTEEC